MVRRGGNEDASSRVRVKRVWYTGLFRLLFQRDWIERHLYLCHYDGRSLSSFS